jgi:RNA polymerase sigma-70 factor (ECF subfamily)
MAVDAAEVQLIERARDGDEDAFRQLMESYQRRTYWIAYNMLHNYELAQDISQEAFIRVYRSLARFDVKKKFYTWLYQIVTNLCIDYLRKKSNKGHADIDALGGLPDLDSNPEEQYGTQETRHRVRDCMDLLPAKYRAVLTLRDIQGFSSKETASILGCTNATARWRLHRARKMFKEIWEQHFVAGIPLSEMQTDLDDE